MRIKLATVNLEVANPELSKRFYMEVLGMVEDPHRSQSPNFIYLRSAGCDLTLAHARGSAGAQPSPTMELGFEVENMSGMREHLNSKGVRKFREESMAWGTAVEMHDTDGHRVIIYAFKTTAS